LSTDFLLHLEATFDAIRRRPNWFPLAHGQLRRSLMKRFPYAVYFLTERKSITVVAVRHSARRNRDLEERY
jgi:plasmid stabilization system protein ParE